MSVLDQLDHCTALDPRSMKSLLESFPEQVQEATQIASELSLSLPKGTRVIIVTGLGGSAIGGDLARSIAGSQLKIPFIVNRDYDLPGFTDASSLVFACSYSGNTEETLAAYKQARRAKASIVCITSGGQLEAMANADQVPVLHLPPGFPPRAALAYSLVTLLTALQIMGLIPDMIGSIKETVGLLSVLRERYGFANLHTANPAKNLAHSLHGKVVAVYGSNGVMDAVAFRWRSQIAENAKNLAFHHALPEMNHNELVGWQYPKDVLRCFGVVFLRDRSDHPQVQRRFQLTRELIAERTDTVHEIWSEGDSLLARVMSVIYLGDFVSLYLAYLNNTDPTPVQVIDYFKSRLSKAD
jgi:glucose/mannose-6-phosphate isomerase